MALLIRVDGEHPLAEREEPRYAGKPARYEMLLGVPEPQDGNSDDIFVSFTQKVVQKKDISGKISNLGDTTEQKAEVSDLVFHTIAKAGTGENATLDNKGLVQVVVARIVDDEVIEKIHEPVMLTPISNGNDWGGGLIKRTMGLRSQDTLKGETVFENTRRERVSVRSIRDVKPLAQFKFALVGHGGLVTSEMVEAPKS